MLCKFNSKLPVFAAIVLACVGANSQAAGNPLAGQMCPQGENVIGFDSEGNIVCSGASGTVAAQAPETMGSQGESACPENCAKEQNNSMADGKAAAGNPVDDPHAGADTVSPVISDVKPAWVVFGARETTIKIIGTGFTADTIVKFQAGSYSPSVNAAGTELRVTIATRDLPMGRYAITVSNGVGVETTQRRALEVF